MAERPDLQLRCPASASRPPAARHGTGVQLLAQTSHVIPGTASWIAYEVKETGFHFRLNKGVPGTMQQVMPELIRFVRNQGNDLAQLDFHVIHTGGPRVLDALRSGRRTVRSAGRQLGDPR